MAPVGRRLEFYRCENCDKTFPVCDPNRPASSEEENLHLLAVCCLVTAADGFYDPVEVRALLDICERLSIDYDRELLGQFCSELEQQGFTAKAYLRTVAREWSRQQTRLAAQMIFLAASATGTMNDAQTKLLVEMPKELGLSDESYADAIDEVVAKP